MMANKNNYFTKKTKQSAIQRQNGVCAFCGVTLATPFTDGENKGYAHHLIPIRFSGGSELDNCVYLCWEHHLYLRHGTGLYEIDPRGGGSKNRMQVVPEDFKFWIVNRTEPTPLILGKKFHEKVQADWEKNAKDGIIHIEKNTLKANGRSGRIDIFVDNISDFISVVEIKASEWDAMSEKAVKRNVQRQIKQVWSYMEPKLDNGIDIFPGIIFSERPKATGRLEWIEKLFAEVGIAVVWNDETVEELRERERLEEEKD